MTSPPRERRGTVRVQSALAIFGIAPQPLGAGDTTIIAIRPEHVEIAQGDAGADNVLEAVLDSSSFIGNSMDCVVRVGDHPLKVMLHPERTPAVGAACTLHLAARHCLALRATD